MARQPKFKQQPKYLVICEDAKSCKDYLEAATQYFRVNTYVKIVHLGCTDPLNIVSKAIKNTNSYERVFCTFDRDAHANFDEAVALAKGTDVSLIISFPCYEFWLYLHAGYKRKPYMPSGKKSAAARLIDDLVTSDPLFNEYKKGGSIALFSNIMDSHKSKYDQAHINAKRILNEANDDGEFNPSTRIHELLKIIEQLANPQPLI